MRNQRRLREEAEGHSQRERDERRNPASLSTFPRGAAIDVVRATAASRPSTASPMLAGVRVRMLAASAATTMS